MFNRNTLIAELIKELLTKMPARGYYHTEISGLALIRHDEGESDLDQILLPIKNIGEGIAIPLSAENRLEQPLVLLVLQGSKHSVLGGEPFDTHAGEFLTIGVDLPSVSYSIKPEPHKPYLALAFDLNFDILSNLITQMESLPNDYTGKNVRACVTTADEDFLYTVLRYITLIDKKEQIKTRAPLILKELHFLLLNSTAKQALKELHSHGTQENRIVKTANKMRENVSKRWTLKELAEFAHMSSSSLLCHFKKLTGFSPLQYLKALRLYEARRMIMADNLSASSAALAVGYESVTQFNREYKRQFGKSPLRDKLNGAEVDKV